jgi:hypothetical protein
MIDDTKLKDFRNALDRLGWDISANNYDRQKIKDDPARKTLERNVGVSWNGLKEWAKTGETPKTDEVVFKALSSENKRLSDNLGKTRDINEVIINCCIAEIAKMRLDSIPVPKMITSGEDLEFHIMRSDAQVGQYTDSAWVQGISRYDKDIYECRVQKLADKINLFKKQDGPSLGLNKAVVYKLGDQVEGEGIFKGQSFALDLAGVEQLFHSAEVEYKFIMFLASIFCIVDIYCVPGNHGRPGRKGDNHPKTNFDYVFYRILQMMLANQPNVHIYVSESPSMLIEQGKFRFLLNHGDNAKSWNGIPYYGLDRVARKVHDLYGMIINYNLCGHHHTPCNLADRVIMNGCLPGGSDFSVNQLIAASRPSQKVFYFHPEYGINRESNLYLADKVQLEPDEKGIYTSYV